MTTYEIHPIAECYPPLSPAEKQELKADIKGNGLLNPVTLYENKVLDGKHRYECCVELGVEPSFQTPEIKDPIAFVISQNERRRHLLPGQRAAIAESLANFLNGTNQFKKRVSAAGGPSSVTDAAQKLGVGKTAVGLVRYARQHGGEELVKAIRDGQITPRRADYIAHLPKDQQAAGLAEEIAKGDYRAASFGKKKWTKPTTKKKGPTISEQRQRLHDMLAAGSKPGQKTVGLSREEVDPDFKGSSREWMDTYGHVQIMTKDELATDRKEAALMAWVSATNDLRKPLENYLKTGPFELTEFEAWIARSRERRLRRTNEIVSLFTRAKESIDWLIPVLAKLNSKE
jgi:hypothetical protein